MSQKNLLSRYEGLTSDVSSGLGLCTLDFAVGTGSVPGWGILTPVWHDEKKRINHLIWSSGLAGAAHLSIQYFSIQGFSSIFKLFNVTDGSEESSGILLCL